MNIRAIPASVLHVERIGFLLDAADNVFHRQPLHGPAGIAHVRDVLVRRGDVGLRDAGNLAVCHGIPHKVNKVLKKGNARDRTA